MSGARLLESVLNLHPRVFKYRALATGCLTWAEWWRFGTPIASQEPAEANGLGKRATIEAGPAERNSQKRVKSHSKHFDSPALVEMLNTVPLPYIIMDQSRQVVFANVAFARAVWNKALLLGKKVGELFDCVHSNETAEGCGSTIFCKNCGALNATNKALEGETAVDECRITTMNGDSLDLRVWATPISYNGSKYCSFAIQDISDEKRRRALERIFFHDVLNTAGALQSVTELIQDLPSEELPELALRVRRLSKFVVEEIVAQRELAAAETGDLLPATESVSSLGLVRQVVQTFENHNVSRLRTIQISSTAVDGFVKTDRTLLYRVLSNMMKNALEASPDGATVTIDCASAGDRYEFRVHNATFMPQKVQLQLFQRSFSTKGTGRGLGTYSMKLLAEKYLNGIVSFISDPEHGTTFIVSLPLAPPHNS